MFFEGQESGGWNHEPDQLITNADGRLHDRQTTLCEGSDYKSGSSTWQPVDCFCSHPPFKPSSDVARVIVLLWPAVYFTAASETQERRHNETRSGWRKKNSTICLFEKRMIIKTTTLVERVWRRILTEQSFTGCFWWTAAAAWLHRCSALWEIHL